MKACLPFIIVAAFALAVGGLELRAEETVKSADTLVEQLRSDDFDTRQHAAQTLEQQGEAARIALEKGLTDGDADVRATVSKLIAKLSRATLRLHVIDVEGHPIGNTEGTLQLYAQDQMAPNMASHEVPLKLDASGNAELKLTSLGTMRFQLKLPDVMEEAYGNWTTFEAHTGVNPTCVTIARGGTLSGTVLGSDGNPIKEVSVTLFSGLRFDEDVLEAQILYYSVSAPGGGPLNQGTLDKGRTAEITEDGKWHADGVPAGVYTCIAQAPGHRAFIGGTVRVRENQPATVPAIVLKTRGAGKIEMKFKKPDGSPLAKTSVTFFVTPVYPDALKARFPAALQAVPLHSDTRDTDENGMILIDDIVPGRHLIAASTEADADKGPSIQLLQTEIEVKAGETVRPEQLVADTKTSGKKGSIKGRILNANGKGAKALIVHLYTERGFMQLANFHTGQSTPNKEVNTDSKGIYRFDDIAPGRYLMVFSSREPVDNDPDGYVFGVDVQGDKQTLAPEAVLNNVTGKTTAVTIRGRAVLPNGSPATDAEVLCFANRQTQNTTAQDDGTFTAIIPGLNAPKNEQMKEYVIIRSDGCKPLLAQGPFPATGRDFRLQSETYGGLRVSVVDASGKPLAGAKVVPSDFKSPFNPGVTGASASAVTNTKGMARLNGLASGPRELVVTLRGYYNPSPSAAATVVAASERDVTVVMHSGARICGRVMLPPGTPAENVIVSLDGNDYQSVGAAGTFAFAGVAPGKYMLNATAPGLVQNRSEIVTIPPNFEQQPQPPETVLELVRPGGIAIDCGAEFVGCAAHIQSLDALDPASLQRAPHVGLGMVDAQGRAEFWNVPPGRYFLRITEMDSTPQPAETSAIHFHPSAGPFDVKAVESLAALAKMEAVKASPKRGTASAVGHLQLTGAMHHFKDQESANITLKIFGKQGVTAGSLSDPISAYLHPAEPVIAVGKPPDGFKVRVPGALEIDALPAGDYTIYATLNGSEFDEEDDAPRHEGTPKLIGSFSIKDGEKLNLGELKFQADDGGGKGDPKDFLKEFLRPDDKPQEFEP